MPSSEFSAKSAAAIGGESLLDIVETVRERFSLTPSRWVVLQVAFAAILVAAAAYSVASPHSPASRPQSVRDASGNLTPAQQLWQNLAAAEKNGQYNEALEYSRLMREMNPRFPAWVDFPSSFGVNFPAQIVSLIAKGTFEPMPDVPHGRFFLRHQTELFGSMDDIAQLMTEGVRKPVRSQL